jgi:hypothetical protein
MANLGLGWFTLEAGYLAQAQAQGIKFRCIKFNFQLKLSNAYVSLFILWLRFYFVTFNDVHSATSFKILKDVTKYLQCVTIYTIRPIKSNKNHKIDTIHLYF